MNVLDWRGPEFLQLYAILLVVGVIAAVVLRRRLRGPGRELPPGQVPPDLHPLEVAYLAGGPKAVADSAIALLLQRGTLALDPNNAGRLVASSLPPQDVTPLEEAVYRAAQKEGGKVGPVRRAVKDIARTVASRLRTLGAVPTDAQAVNSRLFPALVLLSLLAFGIAKVVIGTQRHKHVEFLVMLCFVTFFVAVVFAAQAPLRTGRGTRLLERLRRQNAALRTTARTAPTSLAAADASLAFALFGSAIFAAGPMHDLNRALQPPSSGGSGCGSGSSGCGSGDGGGGGGGGCGGCGGGGD